MHACAHQGVLVLAAQLAQHDDELDLRDVLVAQAVVRQRGPREDVAADRNACMGPQPSALPTCMRCRNLSIQMSSEASFQCRCSQNAGDKLVGGASALTLIEAVGGARQHVVHLVGHAA